MKIVEAYFCLCIRLGRKWIPSNDLYRVYRDTNTLGVSKVWDFICLDTRTTTNYCKAVDVDIPGQSEIALWRVSRYKIHHVTQEFSQEGVCIEMFAMKSNTKSMLLHNRKELSSRTKKWTIFCTCVCVCVYVFYISKVSEVSFESADKGFWPSSPIHTMEEEDKVKEDL